MVGPAPTDAVSPASMPLSQRKSLVCPARPLRSVHSKILWARSAGAQQDHGAARWCVYAAVRTEAADLSIIHLCLSRLPIALFTGPSSDTPLMSAYQSLRVFSLVVLGLMAASIVYAVYIAVTYWTGISV